MNLIFHPALAFQTVSESALEEFVVNQNISQELVNYIEMETRNQSSSRLWKRLRIGRLTSSMFGQILGCREKKFPTSIVDSILHPSKLDNYARLPPAVLRGRNLEPLAREKYEKLYNLKVEPSGLSLMAEYSFIGASGDGLITDPMESTQGVLEIKCPASIKGTDISKLEIATIVDNFPTFCLKRNNGVIELDRKSHYYAQVQGEMAVKKITWADFVVFTESAEGGLFRERIFFDDKFWTTKLLPKLKYFFTKYIVPFLINSPKEVP